MKKINYINNHLKFNIIEKKLYKMIYNEPIFDFHCHLEPSLLAENKNFQSLFEAWIFMDHYKYRAMRALGISEDYITGNKNDEEKCVAFLKIVPELIGNPLYEWVYFELQNIFDIYDYITTDNAIIIYRKMCEKLKELKPLDILKKLNVRFVCTTDDILSDLEEHKKIRNIEKEIKILPSFRPDRFISFEKENILDNIKLLSEKCCRNILTLDDYTTCLTDRFNYFLSLGCIVSDHGFDEFDYVRGNFDDAQKAFDKLINGEKLSSFERTILKSYTLRYLGKLYSENNIVMQLHIGAVRENNSKFVKEIGLDQGGDSVSDLTFIHQLSYFLDDLVGNNCLPKTICYSLDPSKFTALAALLGSFNDGSFKGKIQFGPSWWYNDHYDGIKSQLKTLANVGVLSTAIGFLTDASSIFSYVRHDYYRRVVVKLVGEYINTGRYPKDYKVIEKILKNIAYQNAYNYFIE